MLIEFKNIELTYKKIAEKLFELDQLSFILTIEDCVINFSDLRAILKYINTTCIVVALESLIIRPVMSLNFQLHFEFQDGRMELVPTIIPDFSNDPIKNLEEIDSLCKDPQLQGDGLFIEIDCLRICAKKKSLFIPMLRARRSCTEEEIQNIFEKLNLESQLDENKTTDQNFLEANQLLFDNLEKLSRDQSFPFDIISKKPSINALNPHERKINLSNDELEMQRQTCHRFFRVGGAAKQGSMSSLLMDQLRNSSSETEIKLDGLSMRSWVIALSKFKQKDNNKRFKFRIGDTSILLNPAKDKARYRQRFNMWINLDEKCYKEHTKTISTFLEVSEKDADYFSKCLPYGEYLTNLLNKIAGSPKSKNLLVMKMMSNSSSIKSFEPTDFNSDLTICLEGETQAQYDQPIIKWLIHILNALTFLALGGEVLRRLYRTEDGKPFEYTDKKAVQSDLLPVAILQVKMLALVGSGIITWQDTFGESDTFDKFRGYQGNTKSHRSRYNAIDGQETISNISVTEKKSFDINSLFNHTFNSGTAIHKMEMKRMLKSFYGNNEESDDENYSDEEYENPKFHIPKYKNKLKRGFSQT